MNPASRPVLDFPFSGATRVTELEPEFEGLPPVVRVRMPVAGDAWLVTTGDLVRRVMADPIFSRERANEADTPRLINRLLPPAALLALDPPNHQRVRKMLAPALTPRRVARLRPRLHAVAADLIDSMLASSVPTTDLRATFLNPLTLEAMCDALNVPAGLRDHADELGVALLDLTADDDQLTHTRVALATYTGKLAAARCCPLVDGYHDGDEEVVNLVLSVLVSGRFNTASFLTSALSTLLRNRSLYQQLVDHPEIRADAIEELLRMVPLGAGGGLPRVATQDVWLGDVLIEAGQAVIPSTIAANRDPKSIARPQVLDLRRERPAHLAFGHGPHFCIGAHLARLVAEIALGALTRHLPTLTLADARAATVCAANPTTRVLPHLEVTWTSQSCPRR